MSKHTLQQNLFIHLVRVISETNGISLRNTLELAVKSGLVESDQKMHHIITDFIKLLGDYKNSKVRIDELFTHPVAQALYKFFQEFPLRYQEEHTHLSGSLTPDFVFGKLNKILSGKNALEYQERITSIYGNDARSIKQPEDLLPMLTVNNDEGFERYLEKLYLTKIILTDKEVHKQAAYDMAEEIYTKYNIGSVRVKFTFSRGSKMKAESLPGDDLTPRDAILGLYQGFREWQMDHPDFQFYLSPSFRKENEFFDKDKYHSKQEDFNRQVDELLIILENYPELKKYVVDVDTVGNETDLYMKKHFKVMQYGFRKLQQQGLKIRSHHGEVWHTLNRGIQAVDNAMNIWRINTLEHGLSLGINPNYYFHSLFERVLNTNAKNKPIDLVSPEGRELEGMNWGEHQEIFDKLIAGRELSDQEIYKFTKIKYFTALEVEHYQHDVLNRMIYKGITLTSLPTSNLRLTSHIPDYKDHPFSWWEKKNLTQAIGTDNYITLKTDFIKEMLILLFSDPRGLKITKLLMIATGENRRPFLSSHLWNMRKKYIDTSK